MPSFILVPPLVSNVKGTLEITNLRNLVSITTGAVVTIPRGVSIRIRCIATGIPQPNITWYQHRENMEDRHPIMQNDAVKVMYDNSLWISHTSVTDAAYYTCVASNIAGKDEGTTVLNIGSKGVQNCLMVLYCIVYVLLHSFCRVHAKCDPPLPV